MMMKILLLFITFWTALEKAAEAGAPTNGSLAHCQTKCGGTHIPYPFGVNKGCFLHDSEDLFEATCNGSTARLGESEVDAISLVNQTLRVTGFPVLSFQYNVSGGESRYSYNITMDVKDHFSISRARNSFIVIGCNFMAYIVDPQTKELVAGCASLCNSTDVPSSPPSACLGQKCCRMTVGKDLPLYELNIHTLNTTTKSWECGFFTFLDNDFPLNKLNFTAGCRHEYGSQIVVDWRVGNTTCKEAVRRGDDYLCGRNTDCFTEKVGYTCKCRRGFTGNPYILQGCQDVDECASEKDYNCPTGTHCVNTKGGYVCKWNRKRSPGLFITAIGIGVAVAILILVAFGLWIRQKVQTMNDRKRKQNFFRKNGGLLLQQHIASGSGGSSLPESTLMKIVELEKATNNFSESLILGKGGLGTVYKGMLSDGRVVAIKKANIIDEAQIGQFINEVFILSQINHRHIVKLLGCCLESKFPLLVYEYISNGTLSHHLHDVTPNEPPISWQDRLRIATEIAEALAYLHSYASTAIFHRDIKSSNILLDEKFKAVVSDFGLSRSVPTDRTHLTTFVGGTFGYMDPEYFQSGQLTDKSDVYAFGIILAELLTGQKAISSATDDEGLALRFKSAMKADHLVQILDKVVADEADKDEVVAVAKLAKTCQKLSGRKRPTMKEVVAQLDLLRKKRVLPQRQQSARDDGASTSYGGEDIWSESRGFVGGD